MENEKRLIDANALKSEFEWLKSVVNESSKDEVMDVMQRIDNAPTVDAVEVVRCEDCLYRSQYPDESGHYKCGGLLTEDEELLLMVKPDFFCAYGEKRCKDAVD